MRRLKKIAVLFFFFLQQAAGHPPRWQLQHNPSHALWSATVQSTADNRRRSPRKRTAVVLQESATTMTCPRSAQCHIALLGLRKPSENSSRLTELPKSPSTFVTKMYRLVHQLEVEDTPCGTLHKEWGLSPPGGHCGVVDAGMLFCRGPFWLRVREGRENTPDFNVV